MNPIARIFFDFLLTRNIAFMLFFGALLPMVTGLTVKQSFASGLKHAVTLAFMLLVTPLLFAVLPSGAAPVLEPALVLFLALASVRMLRAWNELRGNWAGIPIMVIGLLPYAGSILTFRREALGGLDAVSAAFGMAAGFYAAIVIVAALIEQIRIAEAPGAFRRLATLCFAFAIFALALAGFRFF